MVKGDSLTAIRRQGYAKHSHDNCMALEVEISNCKIIENEVSYLMLNAPRSANKASTPVKASKIPPSDLHPAVLLRTRYFPAKYGENAFSTE